MTEDCRTNVCKKPAEGVTRDAFLKWASAAVAFGAVFGFDAERLIFSAANAQAASIDVGAGDIGIMNFTLAAEELGIAYYTQVLRTPYPGMDRFERTLFTDIRSHEIAHRDFLVKQLGANRIPDLAFNFSRVNFGDRASVLTTGQTFEDTCVAALNGAGPHVRSPALIAAAGMLVSVEARHAGALRDALGPFSDNFANSQVVDTLGLDVGFLPSQILPKLAPFLATPISARSLP